MQQIIVLCALSFTLVFILPSIAAFMFIYTHMLLIEMFMLILTSKAVRAAGGRPDS